MEYLISVGDALSQLINTVFFLSTNPNESISGRCWRQKDHWFFGRLRKAIDLVASWFSDPGHCANAYRKDIERAQATIALHRKIKRHQDQELSPHH